MRILTASCISVNASRKTAVCHRPPARPTPWTRPPYKRQVKGIIDALDAKGLLEDLKVMVDGAPANQKYADEVGADVYAPDAGDTVALTRTLVPDAGANSDQAPT